MRLTLDKIVQLTFYAVVAYLLFVHWRGANALAQTVFGGYAGAVEALQGRGGSSTVRKQTRRY